MEAFFSNFRAALSDYVLRQMEWGTGWFHSAESASRMLLGLSSRHGDDSHWMCAAAGAIVFGVSGGIAVLPDGWDTACNVVRDRMLEAGTGSDLAYDARGILACANPHVDGSDACFGMNESYGRLVHDLYLMPFSIERSCDEVLTSLLWEMSGKCESEAEGGVQTFGKEALEKAIAFLDSIAVGGTSLFRHADYMDLGEKALDNFNATKERAGQLLKDAEA